ncbi:hypothetical protein AOLI_G00197300 [Acnodon oligacanthus]
MSSGGSERISEALLTCLGFVSADAPGSPFSSDGQIIQQIFPAEAPYRRLRAGLFYRDPCQKREELIKGVDIWNQTLERKTKPSSRWTKDVEDEDERPTKRVITLTQLKTSMQRIVCHLFRYSSHHVSGVEVFQHF